MTIALILLSPCELTRGRPVLGSCSLAISATGHGRGDRRGEAEQSLMYGVVEVTVEKTSSVKPLLDAVGGTTMVSPRRQPRKIPYGSPIILGCRGDITLHTT